VAATNCLNFGNPEKPEIMAQLSAAIDGIAEACTALGTPVTGGNVSLYNETKGEGIYPTPVIGIVGILDDVSKAVPSAFQRAGEKVLLIGPGLGAQIDLIATKELGSSTFATTILGQAWGEPPHLDIAGESQLHVCLAQLAKEGLLTSASDLSDGGIAVALARATFVHGIGADINIIPIADASRACALFGEDASVVIVTCLREEAERVKDIAFGHSDLNVFEIGVTTSETLRISIFPNIAIEDRSADIDVPIFDLRHAYLSALESQLAEEVLA
jgi:phosphoribosylformylglycinamidine synthase